MHSLCICYDTRVDFAEIIHSHGGMYLTTNIIHITKISVLIPVNLWLTMT